MSGAQVGTIGVLSVGAGDTKLIFDKSDPVECIRAGRIVTDMLRRGYALLVEIERNGERAYERVREFREDTCEYIIADFDPTTPDESIREGRSHEEAVAAAAPSDGEAKPTAATKPRGRPKSASRAIDAAGAKAVAVAHRAGG